MRMTLIVAVTTMVLAIAAMWGHTSIIAPHPKDANAAPAPALIDVTQMMKDARNLPVQQFDAH
jgi:hypothetical protein